eukprot:7797877-Alexandrium_andersonii.AAC.1
MPLRVVELVSLVLGSAVVGYLFGRASCVAPSEQPRTMHARTRGIERSEWCPSSEHARVRRGA